MNKLFRKMLALLAAAVLVGQTMFTSIVSAVEAEIGDDYVSEESVVAEVVDSDADVDVLSAESIIDFSNVEPLNLEVKDVVDDVKDDDVKKIDQIVVDGEAAVGDTNGESNKTYECTSDSARLIKLASDLDKSVPNGFYVRENGGELYLYVDNGTVSLDVSDVTQLIDLLLSGDPDSISDAKLGFFWKALYENEFYPTISNVTALIDVILKSGGLKVGDVVDITSRDGCFVLNIVGGTPEDLCGTKQDAVNDVVLILNTYFRNDLKSSDIRAYSRDGEVVISYVNNQGLISYVTALIDYILKSGDLPIDSDEMRLWDAFGRHYQLDISTVTALIDLNLSNESHFSLRSKENSCRVDNVVVRFEKLEPGSNGSNRGSRTCREVNVKGDLKELANNLNEHIVSKGINGISVKFDETTLYLSVKENSVASFDISTVTSLIDYLLTDKASDIEGWGFIRESMKAAGFTPNISNVTELIDFILADGLLLPGKSIPVYTNGGCFNFVVVADNGDSNGNNNGNGNNGDEPSYSGGGSSGGGSSSRINSSDNEELEFGGEVVEPQKAESCSIEGSTYSDEENQAYLWACEKGIILADNIMKANFANPLTRAELDKMMSVYAKQLLGRSYVVNDTVTYPDVDNSLGDLPFYIQEGYKLQIMGIHANGAALSKFLPNVLVTRGEFATVFSRVLYGSVYNIDGANYYEKHLQVLKDAGILTNTNPSLVEARGWVVLMLYRSQKVEESNGSISNEEVAEITGD